MIFSLNTHVEMALLRLASDLFDIANLGHRGTGS